MRCKNTSISLQELPGEISLIFEISNCPHRCPDCHSKELWSNVGDEVSNDYFLTKLIPYKDYISAVIFFGGEWDNDLVNYLKIAKSFNLKTCLYTGADDVNQNLKNELDYLKTGKFISELGGLDSIFTNQKFLDLKNNILMNSLFIKDNTHSHNNVFKKGEHDAEIDRGAS
jgi:anaerobic ribonucleoside-triphosphate reductase activating protein